MEHVINLLPLSMLQMFQMFQKIFVNCAQAFSTQLAMGKTASLNFGFKKSRVHVCRQIGLSHSFCKTSDRRLPAGSLRLALSRQAKVQVSFNSNWPSKKSFYLVMNCKCKVAQIVGMTFGW